MKKITFSFIILFISFSAASLAQQTITILHVNDTHSSLAPIGPRDVDLNGLQGGIARAASVIGYERTQDPNLLLLHAGDISIGDLFFNYGFQVPELTWMSAIGFDAMALGNHEFDLTPVALLGSLQNVFPVPANAFPLLGANVNASAVPDLDAYISDYTTKMVGAIKIGIFGLITPSTNILSQPAPVIIEEDITQIMNLAGANAAHLRNIENCDVVVLLSHLGIEFDLAIASMVPDIDVIISGHDHYVSFEAIPVPNPNSGTSWVVQAGSNYMYIGKMKLDIDLNGTVSLNDYTLIHLDENVPEELSIKAMINSMINDIETYYNMPLFTQPFGYADAFHKEEAKELLKLGAHDTPIGNLVTDAFRNLTGTEIAIHAGGSSALPIWEGPFTMSDIFRVNGYGFNTVNTLGFQLVTFEMTGEALWMGLEFGLSEIESNDEFFIQVSGLEYKFDATKPAGERVVSVLVNNQPINPYATYTVTASEIVLSLLDYLLIPYSNPNLLSGVTEFEALSAEILALNNLLHPKEIGRIVNLGDRLVTNRIKAQGWFNSPAGAFLENPLIEGHINFHMNLHNVNDPGGANGVAKIQFPDARINLTGNKVEFLLIEDNTIIVRGEGKNTGEGSFGFLLTAVDAGNNGDLIKITIWDKLGGDKVIYDNLSFNELGAGYINILQSQFVKHNSEFTASSEYSLEQNYPNPFNPTTNIRFIIPEDGLVQLKIYNMLGEQVSTLLNDEKTAGTYDVEFDASRLSSGIYIYKLSSNNFTQTRKMLLVK